LLVGDGVYALGKIPDGNYAVSVHFRITYNALLKLGYSREFTYKIAHRASVYADHPPQSALNMDNAGHGTSHYYRSDIDYRPTQNSQKEVNSSWHAMMSDAEKASGLTSTQAMERGLQFGWDNIFAQKNGLDEGKLGQGLHALQDAYAHKGAATNEHLGFNTSSIKMLMNDMHGNTSSAELITESAGAVLSLFNPQNKGDGFKNGMKLDFSGMNSSQLGQVTDRLKNVGYKLNADKQKGFYTVEKL